MFFRGGLSAYNERLAHDYIEEHLDDKIEMKELYRITKIANHSAFSRTFKKSFGVHPRAYILRRRLEKACGLIRERKWTCARIAYECGFGDESHFCKRFKQIMDMNISQWRKGCPLKSASSAASSSTAARR